MVDTNSFEAAMSQQNLYEIDVEVAPDFAHDVDVASLIAAATRTLEAEGVKTGNMSILLTNDETVRELNRRYREVDSATDVLSFLAQDGDDREQLHDLPPELADELSAALGDLIIAVPYTMRQATHYQTALEEELQLLVVHGTLHLLGYDHASADERQVMWGRQNAILAHFGIATPADRGYEEDPH